MRPLLHKFDQTLTTSIQQWPQWLHPSMIALSVIGHPIVTVGIAMLVIGAGWARSNGRLMLAGGVAAAMLGIGSLLKLVLHRPRPLTDYVLHMRFDTFSFPSGHALGATLSFGLLTYLLWQIVPQPWSGIVTAVLVVLIILVGISRVYLGAHYPSDVVAGWLMGCIGLAIIIFWIQPKL